MSKNSQSALRKVIDFDCPICTFAYDEEAHHPMLICSNQHVQCLKCLNDLLTLKKAKGEKAKCPQCRQTILKKNTHKFRLLKHIIETAKKLKYEKGSIIKGAKVDLNGGQEGLMKELMIEKEKSEWLIQQIQRIEVIHMDEVQNLQLQIADVEHIYLKITELENKRPMRQIEEENKRLKDQLLLQKSKYSKLEQKMSKNSKELEILKEIFEIKDQPQVPKVARVTSAKALRNRSQSIWPQAKKNW